MKHNISIREATPNDFEAILSLIIELAHVEHAADAVTNTVERMHTEQAHFRCFVAETPADGIVGMALYFFAYYTWVGKSLYLDDIYIKDAFRRQGIGCALLQRVFEVAQREDCQRVRWQALHWNAPALEMYKKYGATLDSEWINCDFDRDRIRGFHVQALPKEEE